MRSLCVRCFMCACCLCCLCENLTTGEVNTRRMRTVGMRNVYCRISSHKMQLPVGQHGETTPKPEVLGLDVLGNQIRTKIDTDCFYRISSNFTHFSSLYYFSISFWDQPTELSPCDLVERINHSKQN